MVILTTHVKNFSSQIHFHWLNVKIPHSLLFSLQDPYIFEPNCQMRVDEFGFFITWKSEGKVLFFYLILTRGSFKDQKIFVLQDFFFNFSLKEVWNTPTMKSKRPIEAIGSLCTYLPSLMLTVRQCYLSAWHSDGNIHIQIFLCVSLCAGRPGSRVFPHQQHPGWRRSQGEKSSQSLIFFLFLFAHRSRMQRTAGTPPSKQIPPDLMRHSLF